MKAAPDSSIQHKERVWNHFSLSGAIVHQKHEIAVIVQLLGKKRSNLLSNSV